MSDDLVYLKQNIQVEPLFDSWYAWSHLISPATAARNVVERHMKIMDSYINAPHVHASAVKNPKLLGGPFIDYDRNRSAEVRRLRENTKTRLGPLFELSRALDDLHELLESKAQGYSLQSLYAEVPAVLRGLVELYYDLNNRPGYRLVESLLYRTEFYDTSLQSILLREIGGDDRPFVLSTPRLSDSRSVALDVAFSDKRLDALFEMKQRPARLSDTMALFDVPSEAKELFRSFFTSEAPEPYQRHNGHGLRWRYFGHACILLESRETTVLVDPVLSYTYESDVSRYTYSDLPDVIDYVLITHNHQDHILLETLLQLRHKIRHIVVPRNAHGGLQDPSLRLTFENIGFKNIIELSEGGEIADGSVRITGIPFFGEHADLLIGTKLAYAVALERHRVLFAADSCNLEPMLYKHVHKWIGDVDVVFIGMECDGAPLTWLYGPLLPKRIERAMDESRRLSGSNFEQAIEVIGVMGCRETYVYAMGQEPWLNYLMTIKFTAESKPIVESDKFLSECARRGIVAERLFGEKEILLPA